MDNTELDDEEANATLDGELLSSLVGVVLEIDLNEAMLGSLYELQASGRKSPNKRTSKRAKVSKLKVVSY
jgi:hypothetical protein